MTVKRTKLTQIIEGVFSGETPVKRKQRKRLSVTFYRKRCRKGWETRKRQAKARAAAGPEAVAADVERDAA